MQALVVSEAVDRFTRLYEECQSLMTATCSNNNNSNSSLQPAVRQVSQLID